MCEVKNEIRYDQITEIDLENCDLIINTPKYFDSLTSLKLTNCIISQETLKSLSTAKCLKNLYLVNLYISNQNGQNNCQNNCQNNYETTQYFLLFLLKNNRDLQSFTFRVGQHTNSVKIDDRALTALKDSIYLRKLNIEGISLFPGFNLEQTVQNFGKLSQCNIQPSKPQL
jgi:hypothetical protein